ncbi:caspase family protein [Mesorhizobium australicum]|uniref:caspase family protein n=1 Tax=Mesorhizobium australicum TaxID=536018 RepID=UPI00333A4565
MTFVETSKPRLFRRAWLALLVAMLVCVAASMLRPVEAKDLKGVALTVGQSRYEHLAALPNPANDARDMAKMLTDLGFDARNVTDRDASKLKRDLERFVEDAEGADGVLKALGTEKIPEDPTDLRKVLDAQAERLKKMMSERAALRTDDPDIKRLVASADKAIGQGAIATARKFLDDAVGRVEETNDTVDQAEELIKRKRIADAAIYAKRADASALVFDYRSAASDYAKAFSLAEKWDDKLRWNYKNQEAEALNSYGYATGDLDALQHVIAYRAILNFIPNGEQNRDWASPAITWPWCCRTSASERPKPRILKRPRRTCERRSQLGRRAEQSRQRAVEDRERESDPKRLNEAVAAMRATLEKRPRHKVPLDWASSQNNLGLALYALSEREPGGEHLAQAEAAYRLALEEYTRQKTPVEWAMVENNLGNTLVTFGIQLNDKARINQAADAFRAALEEPATHSPSRGPPAGSTSAMR